MYRIYKIPALLPRVRLYRADSKLSYASATVNPSKAKIYSSLIFAWLVSHFSSWQIEPI
jgi:hypothetical protein